MPDKHVGILQPEAKAVVALSCSFFTPPEHLAKIMQLMFGPDRIRELVGEGEYEDMGVKLIRMTERYFKLRNGELKNLILEECECVECGHREFYLTSEPDLPKQCAACGKMTTFLVDIPEDRLLDV